MNYLIEIGTEEIPARFVDNLVETFKKNVGKELESSRITFKAIKTYASYRRLTLYIEDISNTQKDLNQEIKGPPLKIAIDDNGNYTPAGKGFLKKNKVEEGRTKDGYLYAKIFQPGKKTEEVLGSIIVDVLKTLPLPIAMRWGEEKTLFIRPVHWILSLLDNTEVKLSFAGKESSTFTYGHRFLTEADTLLGDKIIIQDAAEYIKSLAKAKVIIDTEKRQKIIRNQITQIYPNMDIDQELLDEVTNLVEFPVILEGNFEKAFLDVPEKILTTTMQKHQKYFPVKQNKKLTNKFLIAADNVTETNRTNIINGNERVLRARLYDAQFYYQEDLKNSFNFFNNKLKKITYQKKLGTISEKVERVSRLAQNISELFNLDKQKQTEIFDILKVAKADLATGMVFEFTELQGYVGQQYALKWGYAPEIANGIIEHYLPAFAGDKLPSTITSAVASIADKMDTICGQFCINNIPSGSQDPYALRRQANGIILILLEYPELHIDLKEFIKIGVTLQPINDKPDNILHLIQNFFLQRIETILKEQGIPAASIKATLTLDIGSLQNRLDFANIFTNHPDYKKITESLVRIINLVKKFEFDPQTDPSLFVDDSENKLFEAANNLMLSGDFKENLITQLSNFSDLINQFFDAVLIMDENKKIQYNRLSLLKEIRNKTAVLANFKEFTV